jgi:hypothetical protein
MTVVPLSEGEIMQSSDLIIEAFDRIQQIVQRATGDADEKTLGYRPDADANSIGWLVWHLTRVQDGHIADAFGADELWVAGGWEEKFALPFDADATGYGQSSDEIAAVQVSAELLRGYHDAVHDRTVELIGGIGDADLDRLVDESWDPPVTLGVRLTSVISDDLQHAGQASYVRGLADRAL